MILYHLSRLFSRYAQAWVPGDRFLGKSSPALMGRNKDFYRDQVITGMQQLFSKFDTGLELHSEKTGTGQALLKISAPQKYPGYSPALLTLQTECSDALLCAGRVAAFQIESKDQPAHIIYYGDSYEPDNQAQLLGLPPYLGDLNEIARHVHSRAFADLYARYQQQNNGRPSNQNLKR